MNVFCTFYVQETFIKLYLILTTTLKDTYSYFVVDKIEA